VWQHELQTLHFNFFLPVDFLGLLLIKSSNCFAQEQSFGSIFAVDFFWGGVGHMSN
jgi:hypothetical protein